MHRSKASRFFILFLSASILPAGILSAADPTTSLQATLTTLCSGVTLMLPPAAMLMVIVGAVVYAAGQVMGAETRARANVWATAALMGSFVAMLISTISPPVLQMVYGKTVSCTGIAPAGPATCTISQVWSGTGTCLCRGTIGQATCSSGQRCCNCGTGGTVCGVGSSCILLCTN